MSHYWEEYTCDKCGDPFTREEWCARETPHHIDCPNYDPDEDQEFVECTCDRNYHADCFDFDHDPELAERCQPPNHDHRTCHGVLWQCSECKRWFCCNEGTDDGTELCDTCFVKSEQVPA